MGTSASKPSGTAVGPGTSTTTSGRPNVVVSDDSVMEGKFTLLPNAQSLLRLIGKQVLDTVDANDIRNIGRPDMCKKYVVGLAQRFMHEMTLTEFQVVDEDIPINEVQKVYFRQIGDQSKICDSFAFYVVRVLQLVYITLCHMTPNATAAFSTIPGADTKAALPGAKPAKGDEAPVTGEIRDAKGIEKLSEKARPNLRPEVRRGIADVLYSIFVPETVDRTTGDQRIYLDEVESYKIWYDARQNRLGFTSDGKNYYLDIAELTMAPGGQGPGGKGPQTKAILMVDMKNNVQMKMAKGGQITVPSKKTADGGKFAALIRDAPSAYSVVMLDLIKKVIDSRRDGSDDSAKIFDKKGAESTSMSTGGTTFSNPVFAMQDSMLKSEYKNGGFEYSAPLQFKSDGKDQNLSKWFESILYLLYGSTFTKWDAKEHRPTVEAGRPKWGTIQGPAQGKFTAEFRKAKDDIQQAVAGALALRPPTVPPAVLTAAVKGNSASWKDYNSEFRRLKDMQDKVFSVMASLLFVGAFGLPPLVISNQGSSVWKLNPLLIQVGSPKLEGAFEELRKVLIPYYLASISSYKTAMDKIRAIASVPLPTSGGSRKRQTRQIHTRKQKNTGGTAGRHKKRRTTQKRARSWFLSV